MERVYRLLDKLEHSVASECGFEENIRRSIRIRGRLLKAIRDLATEWNQKGLKGDELEWEVVKPKKK